MVTNYHVVMDASDIKVRTAHQTRVCRTRAASGTGANGTWPFCRRQSTLGWACSSPVGTGLWVLGMLDAPFLRRGPHRV